VPFSLDRRAFLFGATALPLLPIAAADPLGAIAQDIANLGAPDAALEAKIAELAAVAGLTKIGLAAVDADNGRTAFVRGGELFPAEDLNKLPIAAAYLQLVQDGAARLDARMRLRAADIVPGRSPIAARLRSRPTTFTARQLIEHMLLNGDTTATDALIKRAGGVPGIQAAMKRLKLEGMRVDRTERQRARDAAVIAQKGTLDRYFVDQRDTVSPRAAATLIVRMITNHLVQPRLSLLMLDLMKRTRSGDERLKAGMLPGWTFAHRAATGPAFGPATAAYHDVGLATSKKGAKIVLALCIENASQPRQALAQFHRSVARTVLEAWA
jgi:beta-lactamase class A